VNDELNRILSVAFRGFDFLVTDVTFLKDFFFSNDGGGSLSS
jgi:hypothetical protein